MAHVLIQIHGMIPSPTHSDQALFGKNGTASAANGAGRPRVRARRGQATDPHSIAERVRVYVSMCLHVYVSMCFHMYYKALLRTSGCV